MAKRPHEDREEKEDGEESKDSQVMRNPSHIRNKQKRQQMMQKYKKQKKLLKKQNREAVANGQREKQTPQTLDSKREAEVSIVDTSGADDEVANDEVEDEFADIFGNETAPKLMITTRPRPSGDLYYFIQDLMNLLPNAFYYKRGANDIKDIVQWATNKEFTHLVVLSEKAKKCNGMVVSRLPDGPTAFFKVSNVKLCKEISNHARQTAHQPELILNNFSTRLGHRVGRFLGSLFPHDPEFEGRQVVTFHNQRDFIFVRHHRYIFENEGTKARLQEIGPRFTVKMRWLQEGTFDTKFGEYEWVHKQHQVDTTRRRFHL